MGMYEKGQTSLRKEEGLGGRDISRPPMSFSISSNSPGIPMKLNSSPLKTSRAPVILSDQTGQDP